MTSSFLACSAIYTSIWFWVMCFIPGSFFIAFASFSGGSPSARFFAVITFHFISRAHSRSSLYFVFVRSTRILPPLNILKLTTRVVELAPFAGVVGNLVLLGYYFLPFVASSLDFFSSHIVVCYYDWSSSFSFAAPDVFVFWWRLPGREDVCACWF